MNDIKLLSGLSIVLPAYNEEGIIAQTISRVAENAVRYAASFEIVVVNDGSKDETERVVRDIAQKQPHVKLITHAENKGYGEALRSGFDNASLEWILLMDADGQFDVNELKPFVPFSADHDLLVGYRANRADPWPRAVFTWGYTAMINFVFGLGITDVDCGFKLFRRDLWRKLPEIKAHDHKIFTTEWLLHCKRAGARRKELPVHHLPRTTGQSTGARLDVFTSMLKEILRLKFSKT